MDIPSGAVTFLFTDIESSVQLWASDAASMSASLEAHDALMLAEIESGGGYVFTRAGDSFSASFSSTRDAVSVAERCQRRLAQLAWPGPELRVRMGLHAGDILVRDGDYFGLDVGVASRVADTAHGGQVVATGAVIADAATDAPIATLGTYVLRGHPDPVEIFQIGGGEFPPLRAGVAGSQIVTFEEFEVDFGARTLLANRELVHVEPQVLDVLTYLISNRDRLVSSEELLDEVWGHQFVSVSALTTRIKQARQALGDDGRTQRYIRNERGRGYQFVGELTTPTPETATSAAPARRRRAASVTIFGREDDQRAVADLVDGKPLTTIVGPGGVGKTTLVRSLLADWQNAGTDAVMVPLDRVRDEDALGPLVSTTLGLSGGTGGGHAAVAADWLSTTGTVLVLDNCEHILDPVRRLVTDLLDQADDIRVVATSRHRLGLRSESVHRLRPLRVPNDAAAAGEDDLACLELFAAAAERAGGMRLTDDDRSEVLDLCRRLDGLPLAIELAASRLSTLGLRDLAAGLDDRLDWFRNRAVDADERQSSLRSTVEWSFRFLEDDCKTLVAALALFPAGLALTDIASLAERLGIEPTADELVARLVDASVLVNNGGGRHARYAMLETIRQFGVEHLRGELSMLERAESELIRHATDVAQEERDFWTGDKDPRLRSLHRLREELPNLRAARELMVERGDLAAAVHLSVGLCAFTEEACLAELWSWHDVRGLSGAADHDDPELEAAVQLLEAASARNVGDIEGSGRMAAQAADLATDRWVKGRALHTGAMAALFSGDPHGASNLWLQSDEQIGGCRGQLFAAMAAAYAGDVDLAATRLRGCDIHEASAVPVDLLTNVHLVRGEVARIADTGNARSEFEQAVEVARDQGLMFSIGIAQVPLVAILEAEGERAEAASGYHELIELFLRSGTWTQIWITLRNATTLLAVDAPETALLVDRAAAHDAGAPALDDDAQAEADALRVSIADRLGPEGVARVERRAAMASRPEVIREVMAALEAISSGE